MPDRDLKLNSLSRFSKQSPKLVLEEYSHCEVPAGCGGVVLRWRKAEPPFPMDIKRSYSNGTLEKVYLDGEDSYLDNRVPLTYGTHTLCLEILDVDPSFAFLLLAGEIHEEYVRILNPQGEIKLLSLEDGTWRYFPSKPDRRWRNTDFDDSTWPALVEQPIKPSKHDSGWLQEYLEENFLSKGAIPLGIRDKDKVKFETEISRIRVRKTFTIIPHESNIEGES